MEVKITIKFKVYASLFTGGALGYEAVRILEKSIEKIKDLLWDFPNGELKSEYPLLDTHGNPTGEVSATVK